MLAVSELVKERVVQLETVKARFFEAGQGYPTIFLHGVGFVTGGEAWFPCIKEGLGGKLQVFAVDMLGWGASERPTWNYSLPYLVDHIRELQDVLGFEKTNIVGHSLGGWVSALFAYESPERVNKLVLIANAGVNPEPPAWFANFKPPTREEVIVGLPNIQDVEVRNLMIEERWKNVTAPHAAEAFAKINENLRDYDMRKRYYLLRRLPKIKVPTMLVFGEKDLLYPPESMREVMRDRIPNCRYELLRDKGHFLAQEHPKELVTLLHDFLV